ncbi:TPA: hypothetical protein ACX6RX_003114 [Photobacterium damselae]
MSYSHNSALRDATKRATLDFYDELEQKTLLIIEKLEDRTPGKVTAEKVKKDLGINYKVLGKVFSSLSDDGAIEFYVSSDKAENYSPQDMIVKTTETGKARTRRAFEALQRRVNML